MRKNLTLRELKGLYIKRKKSVPEIAKNLACSENKVNYWLKEYGITKRSISDAVYLKYNPKGDPFRFVLPRNSKEERLFGLGLGLYWGEGNKLNKNTVRLGNSDPSLLRIFIIFLLKFFNIKKKDLRLHLHLFSDINPEQCYNYWVRELKIKRSQFYKPSITKTGKLGTYRNKSKYGVLTIYYGNTRLRNKLIELINKPFIAPE